MNYGEKQKIMNFFVGLFSLVTSHYCFVFYFCRLFNLGGFSAYLYMLKSLKCINYVYIIGILSNIGAIAAGVMMIITDQNFILSACDIIIINGITMIFALILVKKTS